MTQIAISRAVQRVYAQGLGPGLIANTDTENSVYVDTTTAVSASSTELPPQASIAVGDADFFASTLGGPAVVVAQIPGAVQYNNPVGVQIALSALGLAKDSSVNSPAYGPVPLSYGPAKDTSVTAVKTALGTPAQTADVTTTLPANIATTGVPLLSRANNLLNETSGVSVAASGTSTQGSLDITQIGYEIFIAVECNASSVTPFMSVDLQWSDSVSGQLVAEENWTLARGSGVYQNYVGTGPTKGDTLNIKFSNTDPTYATSYQVVFTLNSRVYIRDNWVTLSNNPIPDFTRPNMLLAGDQLFEEAATIGGDEGINRILPLYNGMVALCVVNSLQPESVTVTWQANQTNSPFIMAPLTVAAGANTGPILVPLPRATTNIAITNNGASSIQPTVNAIIVRQPS